MSRLRRLLPVAVVLGSTLALLLSAPTTPADAATVTLPSVRVLIDSLSPEVAGANSVLRIGGRVVSTARTDLADVSIQVRRSPVPLTSRKDVAKVLGAGLDPGAAEPAALAYYATRQAVTSSLAPGAEVPFTVKVPLTDLGLTAPGTYVIGIEALAVETGVDPAPVRKGIARTFLPWYPTAGSVVPIDLVWLWPLADWPARTASGLLLNDRTPVELSPGGRLDRLLTVGGRFRGLVSWIADPSLLQGASEMSQGYQVMRDGAVSDGDRQQQAKRWLDRLVDATRATGLRGLPYADVDASAVARAGMSNDVVRAVTQGPAVATAAMRSPVPGNLYWAPFGRIDSAAANVLASAGVTDVVLSSSAMPPTDQAQPSEGLATAALPTAVGTMRAVLTDPGLSDILSLPQQTSADVIAARQQFLAETALIAETIPAGQAARTVVVAPQDLRWNPSASLLAPLLRATRDAPWLSPKTLAQLLAEPAPSTSRQRGGYGEKAREAELGQAYMTAVRRVTTQLEAFTSIVDDPTGLSEPFSAALLRAESAAWRTSPATGAELVRSVSAELGDQTAKVHVLSQGTITFSGDSGRVPVTITNDLDRSVTVGLALQGVPSIRLQAEPLDSIRIEAGKMASVDIVARVVGGDPLSVDVQLLTPEGKTYGRPARITVLSTAYSRAAAWVVLVAFLAILIFVLVGVTRRIRAAQVSRSSPDLRP